MGHCKNKWPNVFDKSVHDNMGTVLDRKTLKGYKNNIHPFNFLTK